MRSLSNSLNYIYKRAIRLIYDDHASSLQDILEIKNEKTMHQKTLERLAKEKYKFLYGLSPPIMNDIFQVRVNICYLKIVQSLYSTSKKSVRFETDVEPHESW